MGPETFLEKIRRFIGHIGWKTYIWAYFHGDEERYFIQNDYEVLRSKGIKSCAACGSLEHTLEENGCDKTSI